MNRDFELKLQAYFDGELPDGEASQMAERIAAEPEAEALLVELRLTKSALAGHESELKLPESREFFWNKIERAIEREEAVPAPAVASSSSWWTSWRRLAAPLAGLATVVLLAVSAARFYDYVPFSDPLLHLAEVESESEHMGSFSFRSHAENMFVVWVYDRTAEAEAEPETEMIDDVLYQ